jgi:hypothetical protein
MECHLSFRLSICHVTKLLLSWVVCMLIMCHLKSKVCFEGEFNCHCGIVASTRYWDYSYSV